MLGDEPGGGEAGSVPPGFPDVWVHPQADPRLKKRLLRAAIEEILVQPLEDPPRLEETIHWQGGVHTRVYVKRPVRTAGKHSPDLDKLVLELARELEDPEIARILNMKKLSTPGGLPWTHDRVRNYRRQHRIRGAKKGVTDGSMTMNEAMQYLGIGHNGLLDLVRAGAITTNQVTEFAPWRVTREELDSGEVQRLVRHLKRTGRLPKGGSPKSQPGLFDVE